MWRDDVVTGSYTLSFREAAQVVESAGAKGASLGRLTSAGFRVPAGFVLSGSAYSDFARAAGVDRSARRFADAHADPFTESALYEMARLRLACLQAPLPETIRSAIISALAQSGIFGLPLVVRPSIACEEPADAAFIRLHRAALNVLGFEALEAAVRTCWAGLWLPEAVAYRRRLGVRDTAVSMAAIIQRLVPADAGGITYTRHPEDGADAVLVRAAWGLGEGVSSGRVEPDSFVLYPDAGGAILARSEAGSKAEAARPAAIGGIAWQGASPDQRRRLSLSPAQATALAETCRRIEQALGAPQVVEWARIGDDISLLQTRPLVVGAQATEGLPADLPEPPAPPWGAPVWSSTPVAQVLPPVPTPLTWSLAHLLLEQTVGRVLEGAGCLVPHGAPLARRLDGRPHVDVAGVQWLLRDAFGVELPALAPTTDQAAAAATVPARGGWRRSLGRAWQRLRLVRWGSRIPRTARSRMLQATRRVAGLERGVSSLVPGPDLLDAHLSNTQAAASYLPEVALASCRAAVALHDLQGLLRRRLGEAYRPGILADILARRGGTTVLRVAQALDRLVDAAATDPRASALLRSDARASAGDDAAGADARSDWQTALLGTRAGEMLADFLRRHGYHAATGTELMAPRWSEDPGYPLRMVAQGLERPAAAGSDAPGRSHAAWASIKGRLSLWDRVRCGRMVAAILAAVRVQDGARSLLARQAALERRICLEAGTRFTSSRVLAQPEDVFFLNAAEMRASLLGEDPGGELRSLVERRRREHEAHVLGSQAREPAAGYRRWAGMAVSGGRAEGRARVLRSADDGWRVALGDVIVTEYVDLSRALLLRRASGLVLANGGLLSLGAIMAREIGIPAVAGVADAIGQIPDGARVRVNGDEGHVELADPDR